MTEVPAESATPIVLTGNLDPEEAQLEAKEASKYLLAKTFFDCREYDRCAAVFLPDTLLAGILSSSTPKSSQEPVAASIKGKEKLTPLRAGQKPPQLPRLSQKSLFLALYAKYMSGEKKKDEDSEMVLGPHDGGSNTNKQLVTISRYLSTWFRQRAKESGEIFGSQGWLEYL